MDIEIIIMKRFLRKLMNLNIWEGRHTELRNLQKALPSYMKGIKQTRIALKGLLNRKFILVKISTGEKHVSLNSHKQKEIYEFLKKD